MTEVRLFLLKIILVSILLAVVLAKKVNNEDKSIANVQHNHELQFDKLAKSKKHFHHKSERRKKSKRSAYRRNWPSKSTDHGVYNNPPPYLVYNRKIGAYYPYYNYPKETNLRRNYSRNRKQYKTIV